MQPSLVQASKGTHSMYKPADALFPRGNAHRKSRSSNEVLLLAVCVAIQVRDYGWHSILLFVQQYISYSAVQLLSSKQRKWLQTTPLTQGGWTGYELFGCTVRGRRKTQCFRSMWNLEPPAVVQMPKRSKRSSICRISSRRAST